MFKPIRNMLGLIRPHNKVKTPVILQLSDTECGIASLAMILAYHHYEIAIEVLRDLCGTGRDGCKASTLVNAARNLGFHAEAYRLDIAAIVELEIPVIAFWNFNHYVVINGIGTNKVFINDPAHGALAVSLEEFDTAYTGIIIAIMRLENTLTIKKEIQYGHFIKKSIAGLHFEAAFLLGIILTIVASNLLNSAITNFFIDFCVAANNKDSLIYLSIFTIISGGLFIISTIIQKWNQFKLCAYAGITNTSNIISHALQLPLIFYSLRQKSEIIAILARVELVISLVAKSTVNLVSATLIALICFIFMMKIDVLLSLASILISLCSCVSILFFSKLILANEKSNTHSLGKIYASSISNIRNLETIKACGFELRQLKKWHQLFCKKIHIHDKSLFLTTIMNTVSQFMNLLSVLIILYLGGIKISDGQISIGNLMAYYALYLFFSNNINSLFQAWKDILLAYAAHVRINDIMKYKKDTRFITLASNKPIPLNNQFAISCRDIDFYYNKNNRPTLRNIHLDLVKTHHIALVGSTGSGKSTLAKLLCALLPATHGEILLFGKNIDAYSADEISQMFAYVSQDVSLFSGSLHDNLTLWNNAITNKDIKIASRIACIDNLIDEKGLHAKVTENGANFSGGEKQRIDIARAIIQNTPIIILDEATSALDNATEHRLIKNLQQLDKTIIFVAHRLSTIKHCNNILVMDQGSIAESGNHSHLIQQRKLYFNLASSMDRHAC